jgi:shikimate dehydrogenase
VTAVSRPGRLVLLGHPVAHSLSPVFQGAALTAAGITMAYEALDVPTEAWSTTIAALREVRAAGNVTVPHKARMFGACARHTEAARRAGAVNTFWTEDGTFIGDNTDVAGFQAAAESLLGDSLRGAHVALLGSGGAAAAVCVAVEAAGGRVTLHGRSAERAADLATRFPSTVRLAPTALAAAGDADLVVNATPLGLDAADPLPVALDAVRPSAALLDLVYRRAGTTSWIAAALAEGRRAADGRDMLLEQGAAAFVRWFGIPPNREVMRAALREHGA